jgi:hypothetical protein
VNVKLLRKIAKTIVENPRQFSIVNWHKARGESPRAILCDLPQGKQVSCGTTHCIAGWAQVLAPDRNCGQTARDDAQRVLALTDNQARRLFYGNEWPKGFGGWRCKPEQAAARIEHFIKTKGAE